MSKLSQAKRMALLCAMSYGVSLPIDPRKGEPKDPLDGIDIEAEYKLIQQEKSKLSAHLRDLVVSRYERGNY
jgi:hypothetical protein